jgi:riboflavin kinase / FMN adenylyltransferase
VSIGNFDGVHLGHAEIVRRLLVAAQGLRGPAVVFTFDPHPGVLLRPDRAPTPLCTLEDKASLLGGLGVDAVLAYPTDQALLSLSPERFFQDVVLRSLETRALVEGANFCFGKGRAGTVEVLAALAAQAGVAAEVVPPVECDGQPISSSRIRGLLAAGQVAEAAKLLGRPYRVRGRVERGAGRGAAIGFATANLAQVATQLPTTGVYAGWGEVDGRRMPAAINLGPNPTFGESALKLEVHLLGHDGPLYGREMAVDFVGKVRDVRKFAGVDELKSQLTRDIAEVRESLRPGEGRVASVPLSESPR